MKLLKTLSLLTLLGFASLSSAEVVIIVNPANTNSLSESDISRAFLGKLKKFADGQSIIAINGKANNETRVEFQQKALKKSPAQVKAYWSKRLFSGKGKPLKELGSDAEIISFVATTPNAIGYVNKSNLTPAVKALKSL